MRRCLMFLVATSTLVVVLVVPAGPAAAHGGVLALVPVLDPIEGLPEAVEVRVVGTQVSSLLEVTNPTDEVLEVLQADGTPWLRISAAGVEVASGAVDTYATTNPTGGSVPRDVLDGSRESTWVRVSADPSWSWFEHRMHPEGVAPVAGEAALEPDDDPLELLRWSVDTTYGGQAVPITGRVELRPPEGSIGAEVTSALPAGISLSALPGAVPGLLLSLAGATEVVVVGIAGEDYLRFTPDGVEVDVASPTHRAVEAARGSPLPPLEGPADPDWQQVSGSTTHAWLETRARAPLDIPQEVRDGGEVVDLVDWAVPLRIDGTAATVTGTTRWLPLGAMDEALDEGPFVDVAWPMVVLAVLGGVGLLVVAARRRRS